MRLLLPALLLLWVLHVAPATGVPDDAHSATATTAPAATSAAPVNPETATPYPGATRRAPEAPKARGGSPVWMMLNTVLHLALVLMIAYGVMLVLKKYWQGDFRGVAPGGRPRALRALRVVESLSLGQGRGLYLVAAGTRAFLVSVSGGQVNLLAELSGDAAVDEALAEALAGPAQPGADFRTLISRVLTPSSAGAAAPEAEHPSKAELVSQIARARREGGTR